MWLCMLAVLLCKRNSVQLTVIVLVDRYTVVCTRLLGLLWGRGLRSAARRCVAFGCWRCLPDGSRRQSPGRRGHWSGGGSALAPAGDRVVDISLVSASSLLKLTSASALVGFSGGGWILLCPFPSTPAA